MTPSKKPARKVARKRHPMATPKANQSLPGRAAGVAAADVEVAGTAPKRKRLRKENKATTAQIPRTPAISDQRSQKRGGGLVRLLLRLKKHRTRHQRLRNQNLNQFLLPLQLWNRKAL